MIEYLADKVRALYGTDPRGALEQLGVEVLEQPLSGRIKEIYFGDFVVVKSGINSPYRDYYLAHALGHHFLHGAGNYVYCDSINHLSAQRKESEAEDFAVCYLVARQTLTEVLSEHGASSVNSVSESLQIANEVLARRIDFYARTNIPRVASKFII